MLSFEAQGENYRWMELVESVATIFLLGWISDSLTCKITNSHIFNERNILPVHFRIDTRSRMLNSSEKKKAYTSI